MPKRNAGGGAEATLYCWTQQSSFCGRFWCGPQNLSGGDTDREDVEQNQQESGRQLTWWVQPAQGWHAPACGKQRIWIALKTTSSAVTVEMATIAAWHESTRSLKAQRGTQNNLIHMAACSDLFCWWSWNWNSHPLHIKKGVSRCARGVGPVSLCLLPLCPSPTCRRAA